MFNENTKKVEKQNYKLKLANEKIKWNKFSIFNALYFRVSRLLTSYI